MMFFTTRKIFQNYDKKYTYILFRICLQVTEAFQFGRHGVPVQLHVHKALKPGPVPVQIQLSLGMEWPALVLHQNLSHVLR